MKRLSANMKARYSEQLYVGDETISRDKSFIENENISAIINLSSNPVKIENVATFSYQLPSNELLDSEIPKVNTKLDYIAKMISELYQDGHVILIYCMDGLNKSLLALGYYLMQHHNIKYDDVIKLESCYGPNVKALTMTSYRKVLRLKGGGK